MPIAKGNISSETAKQTDIKRKPEDWKAEKSEYQPTRISQYLRAAFQLNLMTGENMEMRDTVTNQPQLALGA